ncbi:GGDEF domain-containing protein [Ideonella sp. DXS22W]|uniref:diguanylate cyclase n=1 Tax=Pseudaquabacterium inlustre TaxID=2984192 RepID=A0ABU9CJG4_9BURK
MSELIDHLTSLTRLRDADVLDTALAELARDLMQCDGVAIHRLVHDGSQQRWLTTAMAVPPDVAASPASQACPLLSPCARPECGSLPLREDRPHWLSCLTSQQACPLPRPGFRWLQPLTEACGVPTPGVIEFAQHQALAPGQLRMVASLLRFYRQLRGLIDENERDGLTGLLNRKTFDESFVRAAQGQLGGTRPGQGHRWWLGLVDIDHFKRVNDTHGHLIGDEVLLLTAQLMRSTCRLGDRLYRFGGEEFVVLLSAPDESHAFAAFERLRSGIEAHDFPQVRRLTVSVGFTAVDPDDTPSSAFERADQAVYAAKQAGRNRTLAHQAPAASTAGEAAVGAVEFF